MLQPATSVGSEKPLTTEQIIIYAQRVSVDIVYILPSEFLGSVIYHSSYVRFSNRLLITTKIVKAIEDGVSVLKIQAGVLKDTINGYNSQKE